MEREQRERYKGYREREGECGRESIEGLERDRDTRERQEILQKDQRERKGVLRGTIEGESSGTDRPRDFWCWLGVVKENRGDWLKGRMGGTCGTGPIGDGQPASCSLRINHGGGQTNLQPSAGWMTLGDTHTPSSDMRGVE